MIFPIIGIGLTVLGVVSAGVGIYEAISTGSWHDWGILDWLFNITVCVLSIFPFFSAFRGSSVAASVARGGILARLEGIPLIGGLISRIGAIVVSYGAFLPLMLRHIFAKGGFLYKLGNAVGGMGKLVKHPWVLFGLILGSTFFDGILKTIFQGWNHLSMKAANLAFETLGDVMDGEGFHPIHDITAILVEGKENLPVCFTAIWGAVGADECFGLIMTTLQYVFLFTALRRGYRLYGKGN